LYIVSYKNKYTFKIFLTPAFKSIQFRINFVVPSFLRFLGLVHYVYELFLSSHLTFNIQNYLSFTLNEGCKNTTNFIIGKEKVSSFLIVTRIQL